MNRKFKSYQNESEKIQEMGTKLQVQWRRSKLLEL
jgi:hypothetical protein